MNGALTFLSGDSALKALWPCRTLGKQRVWGSQPERSSQVQLGVPHFLFFLIWRGGQRRTVCRWRQLHGVGLSRVESRLWKVMSEFVDYHAP